jgi:hypothetical protein
MARAFLYILAALTSACSSQVLLTIDSEPGGAAVYQDGAYWGQSPVTLAFTPTNEYTRGGCMGTKPIMVQWDSGAQARVSTLNLCSSGAQETRMAFLYPDGFAEGLKNDKPAPTRRVAPNGQLYYDLFIPGGQGTVLRCYSDVAGQQVRTICE